MIFYIYETLMMKATKKSKGLMMKTYNEVIKIQHEEKELHLYVACPEECDKPRPAVLIFPTWAGQDLFVQHKANLMAQKGYVGIAADVYGQGQQGESIAECSALMDPLVKDRYLLQGLIHSIMSQLKKDPRIDSSNIIAMGYCFGGLCVLDAVRSNVGLKAGISIHGLFFPPEYQLPKKYEARVLALYGFLDPMMPAEHVRGFEEEFGAACEDWQLICFGQGKHAFTNPNAFDEARGLVYHALLDKRTTKYVGNFLQEQFEK